MPERINEIALPVIRENPDYTMPIGRLETDDHYNAAVNAVPFIGADAIIVGEEDCAFYLPYRDAQPARGYWPIGGGVKNGQGVKDAMVARFEAETGVALPPEDFIQRADMINMAIWQTRARQNLHVPHFVYMNEEGRTQVEQGLSRTDEYDPSKPLRKFSSNQELASAHTEGLISPGAIDVLQLYMDGFTKACSVGR